MKDRTADNAGSDVGAIVVGGGGVDGGTMAVSGGRNGGRTIRTAAFWDVED